MQTTFQTVISTDGVISFAAFIYSDLNSAVFQDYVDIYSSDVHRVVVGFDAGLENRIKSTNVLQGGSFYDDGIRRISIFRVDGRYRE